MLPHYTKRAFEILRKDGLSKLIYKSKYFLPNFIFIVMEKKGIISAKSSTYLLTKRNFLLNSITYDSIPHPYKIIEVPSDNINYINTDVHKPWHGGFCQVRSGGWDQEWEEFDDYWIKKGFKERFQDNKEWPETTYFKKLTEGFPKYSCPSGFENREDYVLRRCRYYDQLYSNICENGYETSGSERTIEHWRNESGNKRAKEHFSHQLESLVAIDREGRFSIVDGRHRIAIAQLANISVPVQIVIRHERWQKIRDDIYNNGFSEEHSREVRKHPDLRDIHNRI